MAQVPGTPLGYYLIMYDDGSVKKFSSQQEAEQELATNPKAIGMGTPRVVDVGTA